VCTAAAVGNFLDPFPPSGCSTGWCSAIAPSNIAAMLSEHCSVHGCMQLVDDLEGQLNQAKYNDQ
jgi:hypothetical protein